MCDMGVVVVGGNGREWGSEMGPKRSDEAGSAGRVESGVGDLRLVMIER